MFSMNVGKLPAIPVAHRVVMFVAAGQPERCVQPSGLGRICSRNSRARYAPLKADPAMKVAWLVA
ncbi:unnamed protein product, partial [Aureobasidium pullulans]